MEEKAFYSDKIVIITGASGGIGKSLTKTFALLGATVLAIDLHPLETNEKHENVHFYQSDIAKSNEVQQLFLSITAKFGKPHILINNAAIAHFHKDIYTITDEEFLRVIQVNLCGAFYCSRAFIKANQGAPYGRIIHIASTRWNQNEPGWDAYGASKGGLVSLTSSLAVSLANTPITVNAISPGWIETADYSLLSKEDHSQHPSGRVGKPEDIVRGVLFLTDRNNDFINGQNIVIDGGMTKRMIYI
ncbi:MAG: SDR family oxidoreductase [Bacteroidales bacterium]